jgi:hypothetical protein
LPFFSIYLVSWIGGIFIGWLSSSFSKRLVLNRGENRFLVCDVCTPVMLVPSG